MSFVFYRIAPSWEIGSVCILPPTCNTGSQCVNKFTPKKGATTPSSTRTFITLNSNTNAM